MLEAAASDLANGIARCFTFTVRSKIQSQDDTRITNRILDVEHTIGRRKPQFIHFCHSCYPPAWVPDLYHGYNSPLPAEGEKEAVRRTILQCGAPCHFPTLSYVIWNILSKCPINAAYGQEAIL